VDWVLERTSYGGFLGATLGTETFTDLDYADDVALLAEMLEVLLLALDVLKNEAHPLGLEVNWQKTKIQSLIRPPYPHQFLSRETQLTLWNPLSISAQKSIPLVVKNVKSAVGSVWPKTVSISLIEEYGAPASLFPPKSNYTEYTFNRSSSTVLKHGP